MESLPEYGFWPVFRPKRKTTKTYKEDIEMKHRRFLSMLVAMIMVMSLFASIPFTAFAAGSTVTVTDWDGLQKAVKNASSGQTIQLGANITCKQNGGDRIKVDGKTITLDLNGYTLNRNRTKSDSDGHVIEVKGKSTLTITDSRGGGVIKGGYATRGGGVNVAEGSTCILKSGAISGNKAEWGGGVYAHGTFKMEDGTISGNTSSKSGGGIHCGVEGTLELTGGMVLFNAGAGGAGVHNSASKNVTLKNVHIIENTSSGDAGGFCNNLGGVATLTSCEIYGNTAKNSGGGVFNSENSTLTVDHCVIADNTSGTHGGGIYTHGTLTVTGGEITGNKATNGGGIRLWGGTTEVDGGSVTGNTASINGGGIYVGGATLKLYGGSVTGNTASGQGGGIYKENILSSGTFEISGALVVQDNTAGTGRDVFLSEQQKMRLLGHLDEGAKIGVTQGNEADPFMYVHTTEDYTRFFTVDEGAVVIQDPTGSPCIAHSDWYDLQRQIDAAEDGATITLNRNWTGGRGDFPLLIREGRTLTLDLNGHTLNRNKTYNGVTGNGAVIRVNGTATLTVKDSVGTGFITGGQDSGIENHGTLYLEGGTITGNSADSHGGGGVYNNGDSSGEAYMLMTGGRIVGNTSARSGGGGIRSLDKLEIRGGEISGNSAPSGGGVYILNGEATIAGGEITGNTATDSNGGGVYVGSATLNLQGGSVTKNSAGYFGGGVYYSEYGTVNVQGAPVVKDNEAALGNNVMMISGRVLHVTGDFAEAALLDLTAQEIAKPLTAGLAEHGGSVSSFTYNGNAKVTPGLKDGELFVDLSAMADVCVSTWAELQKAFEDTESGKVIALSGNVSANGADHLVLKDGKNLTLDLNGYTVDRGINVVGKGTSGNGHVIEVKGKSTLTIRDSRGTGVIKGGNATRGGGVNIAHDSTCILEGGTISGNRAEWGGGVYAHGTFKMTGGYVSANRAEDSGGGVHCGEEGTLNLTGGTIMGNKAPDGGGVYNSGSQSVKLEDVTISSNSSTGVDTIELDDPLFTVADLSIYWSSTGEEEVFYGGAGFSNDKGGTATLKNCTITGNGAASSGGGVYNIANSTLTLDGCTVTGNTAGSNGGGAYTQGKLTVIGGEYTGNRASSNGGGILLANDGKASLAIGGALQVRDNKAPQGENLLLANGKKLSLTAAMARGADVRVTLAEGTGVFATGFAAKNPDEEPGAYFVSDEYYDVVNQDGNAALDAEEFDPDNLNISRTASYGSVNSRNWMSAIPGERTINEINIPGTHDSSMNALVSNTFSSPTTLIGMERNARTQYLYIDEQLNAGYRYIDLRVNNRYETTSWGGLDVDQVDDGKNLWMCHGKVKKSGITIGTVWAGDRNGDPLKLSTVLDWVKKFLREHPTEVVILHFTVETPNEDDFPTIKYRTKQYLKQLSTEINPSTGKPYLYMEDGVFGKDMTYYPKLKDCRGQIIPKGMGTLGGIQDYDMGGQYVSKAPAGSYKDDPYTILNNTINFYFQNGGVQMPTDVATHLNLIYKAGTNSTNEHGTGGLPLGTPLSHAEIVNPAVFGEGGVFDQHGYYRGWVTIDGATASEAAMMWRSNFYDMDYVTVTIDSGLSATDLESGLYKENAESGIAAIEKASEPAEAAEAAEDAEEGEVAETEIEQEGKRTFRLIKGTEITLPECLYIYDQAETGRGFQSWNAAGETTNETHMPGETFVVMEDVTFTGQWLADGETSVDVVWQDMDDADGLRADALELQVYPDEDPGHVYIQTVTAEEGWRAVLSGDVQRIVPVWEHIDAEAEGGADTAKGYRYEVKSAEAAEVTDEEEEIDLESLIPSGLVLTLVHTPQATIPASGTISWDDDENRDGLRPESVTLRLMNGEEELDSQTVTAENEWKFDFGEVAAYEDGQIVTYTLAEDEIEGYGSADTQMTAADETEEAGFIVPNIHTPKTVNMNGSVIWEDNGNAEARPQSVTVRLLANGEVVSALTVTPDGASTKLLDVPADDETEGETTEGAEAEAEANADDAAETEDATQRADNIWAWSFTGVPVYSEGSEVNYAVEQDRVPGYTTETVAQNGTWFTNIAMPATIALSFDANGGSGEMASVEVDPRHEYTLPECGFTAPEGMVFAGWTLAVEAPQAEQAEGEAEAEAEAETETEAPTVYHAGDAISLSGNTTLTAQWQPIPQPVVITFDANGGEGEMEAATPDENGEYLLPESAFTAPEGMEFAGWKIVVAAPEQAEEAAEGENIEANEGPTIDPERIYQPDDTIAPNASVTVIAQWQEIPEPIVITFDGNGGTGEMEAATPDENGTYTLPENGFTAPEGAEFIGWLVATEAPEVDEEETEPEVEGETETEAAYASALNPGDVILVSADTTVVAQWQSNEPVEAPEAFTITFDANSGEGEMEAAEPDENGEYTLPECGFTAPEGMEFAGWLIGEEAWQAGDVIEVTENITAVARWQEAEAAGDEISVTVTFEVVNGAWDDGTREPKTITLTGSEGDELRLNLSDLPHVTTPDEGYQLGDWDIEPPIFMEGYDITIGDPITEDTTYTYTYAPIEDADTTEEAEAVSVTVTLKVVNGAWGDGTREDRIITLTGSEGDELRLQFEDIPEITAPDEGYKMGAWDPELSFYWAEDDFTYGDPITEDTTYTYTYVPIEEPAEQPASAQTWMVLFYENGGEGEMEGATVQDQGSFTLPENGYTAPEGTTFAGWLVGEEVHQPGDEVTIGEDTVIMAQWQTNEPAEQPAEGPAEQPAEEPAEQPAEEPVEQPAEEPAEQPAEEPAEQPAEEPAEQPVEEPVEQPAEKPVEQPAEEPVERPADKPVEESAEQPAEEHTEEQPAEEPVEQPAEEPVEQPMEEPVEQPAEKPASARMCTITFNSGGADGEMSAVQAADGSEYTLPDCAYYLDGCTFDVWVVESSNGGEPFGCRPGDRIIVDGDMTITAYWLWDETATENQAEEIVEPSIEYGEEEEVFLDFPAEGLQIEYDDVLVEDTSAVTVDIPIDDAPVETDDGSVVIDVVDDAPSEIGSVFSGAGIAAIVAAAILVIAAAGIAVARKKKR